MANLTYLPLKETAIPQEATGLINTFLSSSSWIWPIEDTNIYPPPLVPGNVQRAFRQTWTNTSPSSRTPSSVYIAITADNHFELFINGALVRELSLEDDWESAFLFSVPATTDRVTFAGWEQPVYDDRDWTPAEVMPDSVNGAVTWEPIKAPDKLWFSTTVPRSGAVDCGESPDGSGNGVGSAGSGTKDGYVF
ncbi:hypothetical protein FA13DRAFT_1817717 [Coprinellus micaceus]|uniref:Uncharacterized protein n=1 Tax=Coprinellus micaceus TaxID=71717 RepID=A0A4Y7SSK0_COPMI|nr:hypothetical protein FA13DRAFT_1817717 [Coprinellus micaceus]